MSRFDRTPEEKRKVQEVIKSFPSDVYTDKERDLFLPEDFKNKFFKGNGENFLEKISKACENDAQKTHIECAKNFYDAIQPYCIKEFHTTTFVHDFWQYADLKPCIAYVNCGADDFNSATNYACPSAMIAERFVGEYTKWKECCKQITSGANLNKRATKIPLDFEHNDENSVYYNESIVRMNDLLYMYKQIKESERGINFVMIEKVQNEVDKDAGNSPLKDLQILDVFAQMDKFLAMPEEKRFRFNPQEVKTIAHSNNIIAKIRHFFAKEME